MHEGVFTEKIVEVILEELKQHPGKKIQNVHVTVGETYHLVLESVLLHFGIAVQGTLLEGAQLHIKEEHMRVECPQCLKIGVVEDHHMPMCSFCGALNVKTVSGNAITVDSIQYAA